MARWTSSSLTQFATELFVQKQVAADESRIVAESLVESNLRGHDSHGVLRVPRYLQMLESKELVAGAKIETLRETPAILCCDGGLGFGQVQGRRLTEIALSKARELGIGCVAARNVGHLGRLGEYTEQAALAGCAAFLSVNDNGAMQLVAPPGGTDPLISTNPLSFAVPTRGEPVVFDGSTSVVALGKILLKQRDHEPCPPGWLQDANGKPTSDPFTLKADPPGSILPLGGPLAAFKGFGLGLLLDMVIGGLSAGLCPPYQEGAIDCNNMLLVVWDPAMFGGREHLLAQVTRLADAVRNSRRCEGTEEIMLPGEPSSRRRAHRVRDGIPLHDGVWKSLVDVAERLRVTPPKPIEE